MIKFLFFIYRIRTNYTFIFEYKNEYWVVYKFKNLYQTEAKNVFLATLDNKDNLKVFSISNLWRRKPIYLYTD